MSGYHSMVLRYQKQMEVPGYKPMDLTGHMLHDDNGDIDRRPTTTKECYHCDSVMSHGFLACQPSYRLLLLPSLSLSFSLSLSLPLFALGPPGRVLNSGATWLQLVGESSDVVHALFHFGRFSEVIALYNTSCCFRRLVGLCCM